MVLRKQYVRYFTCSGRAERARTRLEAASSALGYIRPVNRLATPGDAGSRLYRAKTAITGNRATEGGGAVFFVSNDRTGTLRIEPLRP